MKQAKKIEAAKKSSNDYYRSDEYKEEYRKNNEIWKRRSLRRALLEEERKKAGVKPPRSHSKILAKWARENNFQWRSQHYNRASMWRKGACFARLIFQDRGRFVIGQVELDFRIPYQPVVKNSVSYGWGNGYLANVGEALNVLKSAKTVFENPALEPPIPVERKRREKFDPTRKKISKRKRERQDDSANY